MEETNGENLKTTKVFSHKCTILSPCLSTETPQRDGEDAASSSDSASDPASSLFSHWGHDLGPESRRVALKKFRYYGYNGYLSDRISLTRPIPDLRPDGSVSRTLYISWLGHLDALLKSWSSKVRSPFFNPLCQLFDKKKVNKKIQQ